LTIARVGALHGAWGISLAGQVPLHSANLFIDVTPALVTRVFFAGLFLGAAQRRSSLDAPVWCMHPDTSH